VAELITERSGQAKAPGPHHHQTEIQILTGARHMPPKNLAHGDRVDITIPGSGGAERAPSFTRYVPKLSAVAASSAPATIGRPGAPNPAFVRNTITVNRGIIRVRNLVTWDAGGFPLSGNRGNDPAQPVEIKFLGSEVRGHMANECVLEVLDADSAQISASDADVRGNHKAHGAPNPYTSDDTLEILISNFEFQRRKPVPWGMDFQWLFMAAGYQAVQLPGNELAEFKRFGQAYDRELFDEDQRTLLPLDPVGLPFPYLVGEARAPLTALSEVDARPICVPGDGE
jgi:hypothetical protein